MALDLSPSDRELCSQSTISRLENVPDTRALLRMGRAMVDLYCESFRQVPKRIVLDIDDTFDAVYGGQQLRLFNAHYDEYGFQPIRVRRRGPLRHGCASPRQTAGWQGDSRLPAPPAAGDPDQLAQHPDIAVRKSSTILGVAPTTTLRRHIEGLKASTKARFEA